MATPYLQVRLKSVASTQDEALSRLEHLPIVVMAESQTEGRGRSGANWLNADRALALSAAVRVPETDQRPFSLMAGVAAARTLDDVALKWPNDVLARDLKVGGILVERSGEDLVAGIGLNLFWPDPPGGMGALCEEDPGPARHLEVGGLWAAHFMELVDGRGWPHDEYRNRCDTVGRDVTWEPDGSGKAVDIAEDGGLVVDGDGSVQTLYSGEIGYLR